jgi:hypothetical protein
MDTGQISARETPGMLVSLCPRGNMIIGIAVLWRLAHNGTSGPVPTASTACMLSRQSAYCYTCKYMQYTRMKERRCCPAVGSQFMIWQGHMDES